MDNYERQLLDSAIELLHRLVGYADAKADFKPILHFAESDEKVIAFPGKVKQPPAMPQEAVFLSPPPTDVNATSCKPAQAEERDDARYKEIEFTNEEISLMPKKIQRLIIVQRKRCRMRIHPCGKGFTYEIRFRRDGYNVTACGKTIELAKANMLEKLRHAKPKGSSKESAVPNTFHSFAMFYFETFRKEVVAEKTLKINLAVYNRWLKPYFEEKPLSKITPYDCKALLDRVKSQGKGKTADDIYTLMNCTFKCAIAHDLMQKNPLATVLHIQHERESGEALTIAEEQMLFAAMETCDCAQELALALFCGLRPNEIASAEIHGDFIRAINSKRKSHKIEYKYIPICNRLRQFIENGINIQWTPQILRRRLKAILPNHKLYDLRTTFYTRCQTFGVSEVALKAFVGHSFGKLGNTYTDLSNSQAFLLTEGQKLNKW